MLELLAGDTEVAQEAGLKEQRHLLTEPPKLVRLHWYSCPHRIVMDQPIAEDDSRSDRFSIVDLAYPKLARLIPPADAEAFCAWIARSTVLAADPEVGPPIRSVDPKDDYLLALATAERAILVSGDGHLTVLADRLPIRTPAEFLASLDEPSA